MFDSVRLRLRRLSAGRAWSARPRTARVELRVPNPYGGKPWLTATLAVASTPHAHGASRRLRAHIDGCMRLPADRHARPALPAKQPARRSLARHSGDAIAALARAALARVPAGRLEPLTARRWRSWLDIRWSTSPLDGGADALMPERLRGVYGASLVRAAPGEPRIGVWAGPAGPPLGGVARIALLQIDERDLGGGRGAREGGFNLSGCAAQLVEPADSDDGERETVSPH